MFEFTIDGVDFEWNGSRTVNVFIDGKNIDVFSLNYGRDDYNDREVINAALDWME